MKHFGVLRRQRRCRHNGEVMVVLGAKGKAQVFLIRNRRE